MAKQLASLAAVTPNRALLGTLADGWLRSFLTPAEARAGREAIEWAAAEAGRRTEPDPFGISLAVAELVGGRTDQVLAGT